MTNLSMAFDFQEPVHIMLNHAFVAGGLTLHSFVVVEAITIINHTISISAIR